MAALIIHGLFGDAGRVDAHLFPETGVPVTVTDPYARRASTDALLGSEAKSYRRALEVTRAGFPG